MTLSLIIRLMGFALTVVAALPLYFSDEIEGLWWFVCAMGFAAGVMVGSATISQNTEKTLKFVVVGVLIFLTVFGFHDEDKFLNSVNFLFLVTLIRGMRLKTSRHFFQLIGLSFLILSVSAIVNLGISFGVSFLVYTMLLTWTLVYTHITQQVEAFPHPDTVASRASKFVTGKFLIGSSVLGIGLLLISLVVFVLFPRVSVGYFNPINKKKGETVIGFSDTIDLGHFGNLESSGEIVLRLEFVSGNNLITPETPVYLRGMSFDRYDGQRWSKSITNTKKKTLSRLTDGEYFNIPPTNVDGPDVNNIVEYNIYQEPLYNDSPVVFFISLPLGIKPQHKGIREGKERMKFYQDDAGDLSHNQLGYLSLNYSVLSSLVEGSGVIPKLMTEGSMQFITSMYSQLPNTLDRRIPQFAQSLSESHNSLYEAALAIEKMLKSDYTYTISGTHQATDPIVDFLFNRKEGHCEYFATAMVLMLRSIGVPARPVNGFLGAEYNNFGDYYIVKEDNAHSWVEAFFPDRGWTSFDPSPATTSGSIQSELTGLPWLGLWLDSFKLQWYKWVISYNLDRQMLLYGELWNTLFPESQHIDLDTNISGKELGAKINSSIDGLSNGGIYIFLLMSLFFIWGARMFYYGYRKRRNRNNSPLFHYSDRLRKILIQKGFSIKPGSTLFSLCKQGDEKHFSAKIELKKLVMLIEQGRWDPLATASHESIKKLFKTVRRTPSLVK